MEKKKLRVLMGMDSYLPTVDGVINCMHNYCLHLQKQQQVLAIAPRNDPKFDDTTLPYPIVRCNSMYIPGVKYHYGFPAHSHAFRKEVATKDFDIIHTHSPFAMTAYAAKLARKKGIPAVATYHSNFEMIINDLVKVKPIANACCRYIARNLNQMDEVFVCSPSVEKQARSVGYTGKISYLPFGTDFERVEDVAPLRKQANDTLHIGEDELVFLYVGRVMPLKRIDLILDSLKILHDKGIAFRFYVVGKGLYSETLKEKAKKLGFGENEVIFLGFVERELFPALYGRADLFLFPSIYDNFGLVKVEAAAYHTPGVFIRDSAAGYGVTDGVDGYLSDDNAESFAKRIEDAISDKEKLRTAGEMAGKNLYISWEDCVHQLTQRYEEVIARKKGEKK